MAGYPSCIEKERKTSAEKTEGIYVKQAKGNKNCPAKASTVTCNVSSNLHWYYITGVVTTYVSFSQFSSKCQFSLTLNYFSGSFPDLWQPCFSFHAQCKPRYHNSH